MTENIHSLQIIISHAVPQAMITSKDLLGQQGIQFRQHLKAVSFNTITLVFDSGEITSSYRAIRRNSRAIVEQVLKPSRSCLKFQSISAKNVLFDFNKFHLHVLRNTPAVFHYLLILLSCLDTVSGVFPILSRPYFRCSFTQVICLVTSQLPKMKKCQKVGDRFSRNR